MAEVEHPKRGFIREIMLLAGIALIVGNVIGDAIFITTGPMLSGVGTALMISVALAIIPMTFFILYNTQLGEALPVTMADYSCTSRVLGPTAGWFIAWSAICLWSLTLGIEGFAFASYLQAIVPGVPILPVSIGVILFFGLINYFGIRVAAAVQLFLTALFVVLPLLVFIVGGWPHIQPELHQPLFPLGVGAMVFMIVPAVWCYIGFGSITTWAAELKNPRRNIPLTLGISLGVIAVIYFGVIWVLSGVMPWQEAGAVAIGEAAMGFLPQWLGYFVIWGALFAFATTINTIMIPGSRAILAIARDNVIPRYFSRLNRFRSPAAGVVAITIIGLIGAPLAYNILPYVVLIMLFMMVIHGLDATAVFLLPRKMPDIWNKSPLKFSPFWRWFTWIGVLVCAVAIVVITLVETWMSGVIAVGVLAVGAVYWYARRGYLRRRGIVLEETMRELNPEAKAELAER